MTTEQGQAAPPAGADVLLAGEGGQVLAGRVEQAEGGRLVIVLDGAGEPVTDADWPREYSAEDRVAQLAMLLAAPGLYAALATARNLGVIWERLMTRARRLLKRGVICQPGLWALRLSVGAPGRALARQARQRAA